MSRCGCTSPSCSCVFETNDDFTWSGSGSAEDPFEVIRRPSRSFRIICTSATRPDDPDEGWEIYETDTGRIYTFDGTSWILTGGQVPRARVYRNAASSLGNGAATYLQFNTARWDVGGLYSTVSSVGRFTAPVEGMYSVGAQVHIGPGSGHRQVGFRFNGSVFGAILSGSGDSTYGNYVTVSGEWEMEVNDYVEMFIFQDSGGSLNVTAGGPTTPHTHDFYIRWVAPLQP